MTKEPSHLTHARRLLKRMRSRGIGVSRAILQRDHVMIGSCRGRGIRVDADGDCYQAAAHDPQAVAAHSMRAHTHHLALAGRFRSRRQFDLARRALGEAFIDRATLPVIPGTPPLSWAQISWASRPS